MSSSESRLAAPVRVEASHEAVRIQIFDGNLNCVADAFGRVDTTLPVGLYEIQIRAGSVLIQRMISVRPKEGFSAGPGDLDIPLLSAVPLHGTASGTTTHIDAVTGVLSQPRAEGERGRLVVVLRNTIDRRRRERDEPEPYSVADTIRKGIEFWITDGDGAIIEHLGPDHFHIHDDGIATMSMPLVPDRAYCLRVFNTAHRDGQELVTDQALWIEEGWQTAVFLPNTSASASLDLASVHLVRLQPSAYRRWDGDSPETARVGIAVELALAGLRDGRAALPSLRDFHAAMPSTLLSSLLEGKFNDPMLGILGAHTLLLRREGKRRQRASRETTEQWDHFGRVLDALDRLLPSGGHPDLIALRALAACESEDQIKPGRLVTDPPLLRRGLTGLLAAESAWGRSLIERGGRAQQVSCMLIDQGPWTTWVAHPPVPRMQAAVKAPDLFAAAETLDEVGSEMLDGVGAEMRGDVVEEVFDAVEAEMLRDVADEQLEEEPAPMVLGMTEGREMLRTDATARRVHRFLMEVVATDRTANMADLLDDAHSAWISMNTAQPIHAVKGALSSIRDSMSERAVE